MRDWKLSKILIFSVSLILATGMIIYGCFTHYFRNLPLGLIDREKMAITAPKIRADLDRLMSVPPLIAALNTVRLTDPLLNGDDFIRESSSQDWTSLKSLGFTENFFSPDPSFWLKTPALGFALTYQSSLFENTGKYAFWMLNPYQDPYNGEHPLNINLLQQLIKLRLRVGDYLPYKQRDMIRETYDLAVLALSSQQMTLMIAGLGWLDDMSEYYQNRFSTPNVVDFRYQDRGLGQFAKTLWASAGFVDWPVDPQLFASLFPHNQRDDLILCAALNERLPAILLESKFLAQAHIGEFAVLHTRVEETRHHCRLSRAFLLWEQASQANPQRPHIVSQFASMVLGYMRRPDYLNAY